MTRRSHAVVGMRIEHADLVAQMRMLSNVLEVIATEHCWSNEG